MSASETLLIPSAVVCFVFLAFGCWALQSLARTRASRVLFAAVVAFPLWIAASALVGHLLKVYYHPASALDILAAFTTINAVAVSSMAVVAAISFWLTVRHLSQRPNNSFKPKPLRGSA
jgi:hypothetical protein